MSTFKQNITMTGTGAMQITIPTGMKYVCVYNNTDNTIQVYDDIRTVQDANLRDVMVTCAPYTAITVPLNTKNTIFTVIYLTGGGVGSKVAQLMFDTENLNINTQMGNPGTNQNVAITTDQIGLAKGTQLPASLTGTGNLKVEVMNQVPVEVEGNVTLNQPVSIQGTVNVSGSVEVANDQGNPLPISSTQLATLLGNMTTLLGNMTSLITALGTSNTHLNNLNLKMEMANAFLDSIYGHTDDTNTKLQELIDLQTPTGG